MSLATITTDVLTGGTNNHTTVAAAANAYATDFVTQGVVGAIGLNTGSGGTGPFCVNADASPDMGVTVLAGVAYITATPSSQSSQVLRAFATANSTAYTINANSSGSTKYDWIYLQVNATNANVPDAGADNVTAIYTSRSTSNTSDTGSPPTYGLLLAVVTVANGASSITNSNITDKRFNASIGAQNGSLIVTQSATGQPAIIQAAGQDENINVEILGKGTGGLSNASFYCPYKFSYYLGTNGSSTNSLAVLKFDTKNFDTSSNYSVSTGLFTASIAGFYFFDSAYVTAYGGGNTTAYIALFQNTTQIATNGGVIIGGTQATTSLQISRFLQLSAGDTVSVKITNGAGSLTVNAGASNTWFEGYLVSAT